MAIHVDDLKGTSSPQERACIMKFFRDRYEDITESEAPFECVGIMHTQDKDFTCVISQDHYVTQLRPIEVTQIKHLSPEAEVVVSYVRAFQSLLGGLAWLTLTRPDIVVFVGRLQRCGGQPLVRDVLALNTLLRWVKRVPCKTAYKMLEPPVCIACIADSAYRADDDDCLALRSCVTALIEVRDGIPGGRMHVWDFYGRKQTRVNRGTFGAELNNALEASESGMMFRGVVHEITVGPCSSSQLHSMINGPSIPVELHLIGDAHAVFTAVTAGEVKIPNERSLIYAVRALRDRLDAGGISSIHRCDTRDMLADALTKGTISRSELLRAFATGEWTMKVKEQLHSWSSPSVIKYRNSLAE